MSSGAAIIVVVILGIGVSCSLASSGFLAMVNEKVIDIDAFDFLLIPGWGKPGSSNTPADNTKKHCIDTAITECATKASGEINAYETCLNDSKAKCIADGGTWTASTGSYYTTDCTAGSRVHCTTKREKERETCLKDYKTLCAQAASKPVCNPDILGLGLDKTEWVTKHLDGTEFKCVAGYTDTKCGPGNPGNETKQCARAKPA